MAKKASSLAEACTNVSTGQGAGLSNTLES